MKTADEVLRCFEDDNEFHFHDIDRVWIIEAMEEYAKQVEEKALTDASENAILKRERYKEF